MKQVSVILLTLLLLIGALPMGVWASSAGSLSAQDLTAATAVLVDAETGQVLYDKDMSRRMYPASTTKIMTGLLTVENCEAGEMVTTNPSAVDAVPRNTSHIWLDYDERLPLYDAMYALMLPSANDAANALAEHVAGSQAAFVDMMNARAQELGAVNTHFTNAHGLHDANHYTTAYDLSLITQAAYENADMMRYMGTARYTMPPTNKQDEARPFTNQQWMLVQDMWVYNPDVLGGKIGFTDEARWTMSTIARKNGRTLIAVVLHSATRDDMFYDTQALLDYGFDQFADYTVPGEMLTGEVDNVAYRSDDVQVLLPRTVSAQEVQIDIQIEGDDASAVLRLASTVEGLPSELLSVPLQVDDQFGVPTSAALSLEPERRLTFWGVAKRVLTVLLWILCILMALLILLLIRRNMVIRKRKRLRAARMQRLRRMR